MTNVEPHDPDKIPSTSTEFFSEIKALILSLHEKFDAQQPCECLSLRHEISQIKEVVNLLSTPSSPPSPIEPTTYSLVKRALGDANKYADKQLRAVWVGKPQGKTVEETLESDQTDLEKNVFELNNNVITDALQSGEITHHRHPKDKPGNSTIVKYAFTNQKIRDMFLYEVRKIHPKAVTEIKGSFIRRALCPFELELERAARKEAYKLNIKMNCLAYGVCDERLIQFRQPYRPLPANYGNRDPSRKNWNKKKTDEDPPPNEEQPGVEHEPEETGILGNESIVDDNLDTSMLNNSLVNPVLPPAPPPPSSARITRSQTSGAAAASANPSVSSNGL